MKNYSQNNEQQVIIDYFGPDYIGTFIDIGANNGITFSNTRALVELGWKGILIEPSPKAFHKLKQLYPKTKKGIYTYDYAIGNKIGDAVLNESGPLCSPNDIALVSTFQENEMNRFKNICTYEQVTVKMITWRTFYNKIYIKTFDVVSIDVEGMETIILKQMDLEKLKVKLLCLEWNGNAAVKSEFDILCEGYKVIYTSSENLIYAK